MCRVGKYIVVGGCLGVLLLASYAACEGYLHGAGANRQHPPGPTGAFTNTMIMVGFYGLGVWVIGAFTGRVAALVCQTVERLSGRERT